MDIKGIAELQNANVKSSGNSPVKMPSIFGKAMKKYYALQIKRYEKKYAYEQETSKLIYDHYEEAAKQNMGEHTMNVLKQAYNDSNNALFRYEDKLKKIYSKYDGLNNRVEGFNKAQINKKLAKELAHEEAVELQKKPINPTPQTTAFLDPNIATSQTAFDQLVNMDNLEVSKPVEPVITTYPLPEIENIPKKEDFEIQADTNVATMEPVQQEAEPKLEKDKSNDKITEFSTYFSGVLKENENLLDENANLKKQIEYQADQLNELKQAVEELKKQMSNPAPVSNNVEVQAQPQQPVHQAPQIPDFMQYTNKINQSKSIDELTTIENQLRIDKSRFNLTDIQYNVLMSNISNAKKKFELKQAEQQASAPVFEPQPVQATPVAEPQPVPLNVEPVIPDVPAQIVQPQVQNNFEVPNTPVQQYDSNAFITYCNKVSDAVNNHDLDKLKQIQAEIQFNKVLFTEAQFTYLINNVNNNMQNLNNQYLKGM